MVNKIEPTISGLAPNSGNSSAELKSDRIDDLYLSPEEIHSDEIASNNSQSHRSLLVMNILIMLLGSAYILLSFIAINKFNQSGVMAVIPLFFGICIVTSGYIPYYGIKYSVPKKNKAMGIVLNFLCVLAMLIIMVYILLLSHLNPLYLVIPGALSLPFIFNISYLIKQ